MENNKVEKIAFLIENKDVLMNNFFSINYLLVRILTSEERLEKLEEYKQISKIIETSEKRKSDKDVEEIINYLLKISDKLCMYDRSYSCRTKLKDYLDYLNKREELTNAINNLKMKNKTLVKRRISA